MAIASIIAYIALLSYFCVTNGGVCPNDCGNKGVCQFDQTCECQVGYTGPDCSQKICPSDRAWVGKAFAENAAHDNAECSNMGICNRQTGFCKCFNGYEGNACQRLSCPNNCNGHGICKTMKELFLDYTKNKIYYNYSTWDANHATLCDCDVGFTGPSCEERICPKGDDPLTPFVTYPSISIRTTYRLQKSIDVPNLTKKYSSNGYFRITFQNESLFVPIYQYQGSVDTSEIQLPINGSKCNSLFESNWKNVIKQVNCVPTLNSDGVTYVITFLSFPAYSHENNIYYISPDGRLDISQFFCEPFMVTGLSNGVGIVDNKASCTVIDTTPSNMAIPEYAPCSNRGVCTSSGQCNCYDYFFNANCERYYVVPDTSTILKDIYLIETIQPDYFNSLLSLWCSNELLPAYSNYINITDHNISRISLLTVNGRGDWSLNYGYATIAAGMKIYTDGLTIGNPTPTFLIAGQILGDGLLTVKTKGVIVYSGDVNLTPALHIKYIGLNMKTNVGLNITHGRLNITTGGLYVMSGGVSVLTRGVVIKDGDGALSGASIGFLSFSGGMVIKSGGLLINSGDVHVSGGGLYVTQGFTVVNGGLVASSNVYVNAIFRGFGRGLIVNNDGMTIEEGGLTVHSGMTVDQYGLHILTAGVAVNANGVQVFANPTSAPVCNGGLKVSGGMSIQDVGINLQGGLRLKNSDLVLNTDSVMNVLLGGVSVQSNGLTVTSGGMTLYGSVGLTINSAISINSDGLSVSVGNVNVRTGGVSVVTGGLNIGGLGLNVYNGVTINDIGLSVSSGGLTIASGGLKVLLGGLDVLGSTGMTTNDAVTVSTGGVTVAAGDLNVVNSGLVLTTGNLDINSGLSSVGGTSGLRVASGGATINSGGISVISGGLRVQNGGMSVLAGAAITDGVTVNTNGLSVPVTGVTVAADGIMLNSGLQITTSGVVIDNGGLAVKGGVLVPGMSISVDGLTVTGGVTVYTDGLTIQSGGMTITEGGIHVQSSLTTSTLDVVQGGMTIKSGGVSVASGVVFTLNGGLRVNSDVTVVSGGLTVVGGMTVISRMTTDSMTVASGGLLIAGGPVTAGIGLVAHAVSGLSYVATLSSATTSLLRVTGHVSIEAGGLAVTGSMRVSPSGLTVTGGMTVASDGLGMKVLLGSVTAKASGVTTDSATVRSGGVTTDDMVYVQTGGLYVSSAGVTVSDSGLMISSTGLIISSGGLNVDVNGVNSNTAVITGNVKVSGIVSIAGAAGLNVGTATSVALKVTASSSGSNFGIGNSGSGGLTITSGDVSVLGGASIIGGVYVGGNTVGPTGGLTVYGVTNLQTAAHIFSDHRLKRNIQPLQESLQKVSKLRGVSFEWNNNHDEHIKFDSERHIGLIAQEVREVFPELVCDISQGKYLGVRYTDIVAILIEAVKELQSKYNTLVLSVPTKELDSESVNHVTGTATTAATSILSMNSVNQKDKVVTREEYESPPTGLLLAVKNETNKKNAVNSSILSNRTATISGGNSLTSREVLLQEISFLQRQVLHVETAQKQLRSSLDSYFL